MARRRRKNQQTTIEDGAIELPVRKSITDAAPERRIFKIDKGTATKTLAVSGRPYSLSANVPFILKMLPFQW